MTPGEIVWVPFPHVESNRLQSRPALVVATGIGGTLDLFWALMITSAANPAWPDDVLIDEHTSTGLPAPSRIRLGKIATLAAADATPIGRLPDAQWRQVRERLVAMLSNVAG